VPIRRGGAVSNLPSKCLACDDSSEHVYGTVQSSMFLEAVKPDLLFPCGSVATDRAGSHPVGWLLLRLEVATAAPGSSAAARGSLWASSGCAARRSRRSTLGRHQGVFPVHRPNSAAGLAAAHVGANTRLRGDAARTYQ